MGFIETVFEDISDAAKFSLEFIKEKSTVNTFIMLFIIAFISFLVQAALGFLVERTGIPGALPLLALSIVASVLLGLMSAYVTLSISLAALRRKGFGTIQLNIREFVRLILGGIAVAFCTFLGLMDIKLLIPSVILLGAGLLALVSLIFSFAAFGSDGVFEALQSGQLFTAVASIVAIVLVFLLYLPFLIYSSVRLAPWQMRFLSRGEPIREGIRATWKSTESKFWRILIATSAIGVVLFVIVFIPSMLIAGVQVAEILLMRILLGIEFYPVSTALSIALSTIVSFPSIYAFAAIYARVVEGKKLDEKKKP